MLIDPISPYPVKPMKPDAIGVVITTYNSPDWLSKVLTGYENQTIKDFRVIIADDGSTDSTRELIERFKERGVLAIDHVWQEDEGFRKCRVLNEVIGHTDCDYLVFTDGDCIPEPNLVETHRDLAKPGFFLSGGYIKLTSSISENISDEDIRSGVIFDAKWLVANGQPRSHKLWKLTSSPWVKAFMNTVTPAAASWNGMNSSTWTKDLMAVNGFNEDMQYGGLDRELGERLWNFGHKSRQIRFSTVCLHLDHARGYSKPEIWAKNRAIREAVKDNRTFWAENGIEKNVAS
ncbi:glycosyltransferase family 2 protein [Marinobacter fonticola]|uniref:glycosyltransferase family 2 protein n=1 Tax=Marinobacter fonticola TaxID=2603215 RepID=UPI001D0D8CBD|nr:glycosyltransferase family 2 protein [Marinobacter fonticola]